MYPRMTIAWLLPMMMAVSGCGSCDGESEASGAGSGTAAPEGESGSLGDAVLQGVVRLAPDAELPAFTRAEMGFREAAPPPPDFCPPPRRADSRPVALHEGRGLEGILVSISRDTPFDRLPEPEPQRREVTVRDCRLQPGFIVARVGDALVLKNEDDYPFMPRVTGDPFMQGLLQGQERVIPLEAGGRAVDIRCAMTAACGRVDVVVLGHPFFALTDGEGHFRIEGLPAGEFNVHAWHPLFREARVVATASGSSEGSDVELVIQPRPGSAAPAAAAAEEDSSGDAEERPAGEAEPPEESPAEQEDILF